MTRTWAASLLTFVFLTVGYALVHISVSAWIISIGTSIRPELSSAEWLQITDDGEPLILSAEGSRRLDGTPIREIAELNPKLKHVTGVSTYLASGMVSPDEWSDRIAGMQDVQLPSTYWYHVIPPSHGGRSYLESYDALTRRPTGYIGINGFQAQRPDVEQSFPIPRRSYYGVVVAAQSARLWAVEGGAYTIQEVPDNVPVDAVWLLAADTIYEIRLGARTVRPLLQNQPQSVTLTHQTIKRDGRLQLQLMVRSEHGLTFVDPTAARTEFVALPLPPPGKYELFHQTSTGQRILVVKRYADSPFQHRNEQEIIWLNADGGVERRTTVALQTAQTSAIALALCMPAPAISLSIGIFAPWFSADGSESSSSVGTHRFSLIAELWPWMLSSLLIGVWAAWDCRRRERLLGGAGWFRPIVVGLCGWFGWVAYVCLRPLPARLPNGQRLPSRPEPNRPVGTEIFA